jgi:CRISPR-associated protein Cas1
MERVIEIQNDGHYLNLNRGFLVVSKDEQEVAQIPVEDIGVLIVSSKNGGISFNLINRLLDNGAMVVLCGATYHPSALLWPVVHHHQQKNRIHLQMNASKPLEKRIWQQIVKAKVEYQGEVLYHYTLKDEGLPALAKFVKSGDPDNIEAQAARRYWQSLFGDVFRRNPDLGGANALLNYGYAVLRAAVARAVAGAGLNPSLGIHHHNEANPFCLIDDLMEPYRPFVDFQVKKMHSDGIVELTPEVKKKLAGILSLELRMQGMNSPLSSVLQKMAQSFVTGLEKGEPEIEMPLSILPVDAERRDATI